MRGGDERSGSLFSYLNLEARVGKAARCLLPGRFISTDLPLMGPSTLTRRQRLFESARARLTSRCTRGTSQSFLAFLSMTTSEETLVTTVDSRRETVSLIGSDKVDGTAVYGADDQKIRKRTTCDDRQSKRQSRLRCRLIWRFSWYRRGYYPLLWPNLKYDRSVGGYCVGITEDQLKGAPRFDRNTEWDWSDRSKDRAVYDYYRAALWY